MSRTRNRHSCSPSERGIPFTTTGFAKLIKWAGDNPNLAFKAHPHMLRHACGFALANKGHDTRSLQAYLGHRNISTRCVIRSCRRIGLKIFGGSCQITWFAAASNRRTYGASLAFFFPPRGPFSVDLPWKNLSRAPLVYCGRQI